MRPDQSALTNMRACFSTRNRTDGRQAPPPDRGGRSLNGILRSSGRELPVCVALLPVAPRAAYTGTRPRPVLPLFGWVKATLNKYTEQHVDAL